MLNFKSISMRNFLSFGNVPQKINLEDATLSIIVGINNDASTDDETRNGVGKSSMIQALHFALYGKSIDNKIKLSNLVNKTNKKNCVVDVEFEVNGNLYRIVRGRSPSILEFYANGNQNTKSDEAQGENKETQKEIETLIGMSQDVFSQIVTLTTNTEPFLALSTSKQRVIIDELFTLSQLSEKAEKLKEQIKGIKEDISREQFQLQTIENSNSRINETIASLINQQTMFENKRKDVILKLTTKYNELKDFNFSDEIAKWAALEEIKHHNLEIKNLENKIVNLYSQYETWNETRNNKVLDLESSICELELIDIKQELENHASNNISKENKIFNSNINTEIKHIKSALVLLTKKEKELTEKTKIIYDELLHVHTDTCPLCKSVINKDVHADIMKKKQELLDEYITSLNACKNEINDTELKIKSKEQELKVIPEVLDVYYDTELQAKEHEYKISSMKEKLENAKVDTNPYEFELTNLAVQAQELGSLKDEIGCIWNNFSEIQIAQHTVSELKDSIDHETSKENPYTSQIEQLKLALEPADTERLNYYRKVFEHQEFLIKLLTDKNSYVRKMIINQNLAYLNERLKHYIEKSSSLHVVRFENDLSVDITKFGESYDYDNLSRGEKTRIIISLSLAFRDLYESLNSPINSLLIDEFLDNGLDAVGVKSCYDIINGIAQHKKNCFLITHREEIKNKSSNTVTITMEGGFSTIDQQEGA